MANLEQPWLRQRGGLSVSEETRLFLERKCNGHEYGRAEKLVSRGHRLPHCPSPTLCPRAVHLTRCRALSSLVNAGRSRRPQTQSPRSGRRLSLREEGRKGITFIFYTRRRGSGEVSSSGGGHAAELWEDQPLPCASPGGRKTLVCLWPSPQPQNRGCRAQSLFPEPGCLAPRA